MSVCAYVNVCMMSVCGGGRGKSVVCVYVCVCTCVHACTIVFFLILVGNQCNVRILAHLSDLLFPV